jgi:hypothetical protein
MIFEAIAALIVVFLILRKSGTLKQHMVAFLAAGILSGIVAFAIFEMTHPYSGYASGTRFDATMEGLSSWVLGSVAGFVLGAVGARLFRAKATTTVAKG